MTAAAATPDTHARAFGDVFTRRWVVDVLLDLTGYTAERDLAQLRLVEPSAGAGAFLLPAIERLLASARARGHSVEELTDCIRAWELQPQLAMVLRRAAAALVRSHFPSSDSAERLAGAWVTNGDYLLAGGRHEPATVDVVMEAVLQHD